MRAGKSLIDGNVMRGVHFLLFFYFRVSVSGRRAICPSSFGETRAEMFFLQNRRPPFQPLRVPRLQRNDGPLGAIYSRSASSRSISPGLEDTSSLSSSNVSVLIVISQLWLSELSEITLKPVSECSDSTASQWILHLSHQDRRK